MISYGIEFAVFIGGVVSVVITVAFIVINHFRMKNQDLTKEE